MRLDLDCHVECVDGGFGGLADLVIDPAARRLTHLVVAPRGRHELARIVPIAQASPRDGSEGGVSLKCTIAELNELEPLETSAYVRVGDEPVEDPGWSVGIQKFVSFSDQISPVGGLGAGPEPLELDPHVIVRYDRVPMGTVEIRRESEVVSSTGHHLGHVAAVVLDDQAQITQLVLEHGHLWGKREIAVPIGAIDRVESDGVVLRLSGDEVGR